MFLLTGASAQETASQATLTLQGYYLGDNRQGSDISGTTFEFRHFLPKVGLFSGSLAPYAGDGRLRLADNYLELMGLRWKGMRWTLHGGDTFLGSKLVPFPFSNLYYPQLSVRGFQVGASSLTREYTLFWGHETVLAGPRVPFRVSVPQLAAGFSVKQKFGRRLEAGARLMRLSSTGESMAASPAFFGPGRDFRAVNIASFQALASVAGPLKVFSETSASFGIQRTSSAPGAGVPFSVTAGPVLETRPVTLRANYVSQTAAYLPLAGHFLGDRRGPFAEIEIRTGKRLNLFGSVSRYRNNLEGARDVATLRSSSATGGAGIRLPARFALSGSLSVVGLSSTRPDGGVERPRDRQVSVEITRPVGRHNLQVTGREFRSAGIVLGQRQRTAEFEDMYQLGWLSAGGTFRVQRQSAGGGGTSLSGRGIVNVRLRRLSAYASLEAGNDLRNSTLFATVATSTSVAGASVQLTPSWTLQLDAYRNRLVTKLNPERVFVLQSQGRLDPVVLSLLNRWSLFFRVSKQFRWGSPLPRGGIQQFTISRIPLVGSVEGFVWQQTLDGRKPAAGVAVRLGQERTSTTQSDGRFRFADVAAGTHKVELDMEGLPAEFNPGEVSQASVAVQPTRIARVDLEVISLTSIHGRIAGPEGTDLSKVVIRLLPTDRYTTADRSGNFYFENLPEGDYTVVVEEKTLPQFYLMLTPGSIPAEARAGGEAPSLEFRFEVRPPVKPVRKVYEGAAVARVAAPSSVELLDLAAFRPRLDLIPKPAAPPSAPALLRRAVVQVGAFRSRANAERLMQTIGPRYGGCRVVSPTTPAGLWRVVLGDETDQREAARLEARVREEFGTAALVWLYEAVSEAR